MLIAQVDPTLTMKSLVRFTIASGIVFTMGLNWSAIIGGIDQTKDLHQLLRSKSVSTAPGPAPTVTIKKVFWIDLNESDGRAPHDMETFLAGM